MAYSYGKMGQNIQETGKIIKLQEKEHFIILMVMFTLEIGQKIVPQVMENIHMLKGIRMKVNGLTMFKMDKVKNSGQMALALKDYFKMV